MGLFPYGAGTGNGINFTYDNDSLLTSAGSSFITGGLLTLARDAQNGLLTGTTLGNVTDTINYDGFAESTSYAAKYSGANIYDVHYTYDGLSRITQKVETIDGATTTFGGDRRDNRGAIVGVG